MAPSLQRPAGMAHNGTGPEPASLEEVLDRIEEAANQNERVSVDVLLDHVGRSSFGPVLVFAGLVISAPIVGDIPGVPTLMGLFVFLTAGQLLLHSDHLWLPRFILRRSVSAGKVQKALSWLRKPAGFVDRHSRARLRWLTGAGGHRLIAGACLGMAVLLVPMEVIPFSANLAGAAIVVLGLALMARDGLLATLGLVITAATLGIVLYNLL